MISNRAVFATLLVLASLSSTANAQEWSAYRYSGSRTGEQPSVSDLSNPAKVAKLSVKWQFPAPGKPPAGPFNASPIVANDTVFIGSKDGRFYALEATNGKLKWEYPPASQPALVPSNTTWVTGVQSSAAYWSWGDLGVVIFGAPDPGPGSLGSSRLFALDATTGGVIWKSDMIAKVNGVKKNSLTELHQRIAYSAPLIFDNKVYVGIHDTGDDPVQVGRVIAVDLLHGKIDPNFKFRAVGTSKSPPGTRGGGVWNAPAADASGVYFTTGNTRDGVAPQLEPIPNHGLSLIRVNKDSGKIVWAFQPVPYHLDDDPDWSAGATVMSTSCGVLVASVQKDGWSYAVEADSGTAAAPKVRWQFPPTGFPFTQYHHGDTHYKRPGAAWGDVLIITTGGESRVQDGVTAGYGKLHALNACAQSEKDRVRWIAEIPNSSQSGYSLGAPAVTGGIVFIGTDQGHLVVLADPSIVPGTGWRCSNIDFTTATTCKAAGFVLVPTPKVLADVYMPDGGNIAGLRDEPALANGRVFVATGTGHVYMLNTKEAAAKLPNTHDNCIAGCEYANDQCMADVDKAGHQLPKDCLKALRTCETGCN